MEDSGNQFRFFEKGILTDFQVSEPGSTSGSITPPIAIAVAPNFSTLASVNINIEHQTDRVWLNATVGLVANFESVGTVDVTLQLLRGTTVIYQTTKSISSPKRGTVTTLDTTFTTFDTVHLEHVDTTPLTGIPETVTYTLRAQANQAIVTTSGPITLTAAELEQNPD